VPPVRLPSPEGPFSAGRSLHRTGQICRSTASPAAPAARLLPEASCRPSCQYVGEKGGGSADDDSSPNEDDSTAPRVRERGHSQVEGINKRSRKTCCPSAAPMAAVPRACPASYIVPIAICLGDAICGKRDMSRIADQRAPALTVRRTAGCLRPDRHLPARARGAVSDDPARGAARWKTRGEGAGDVSCSAAFRVPFTKSPAAGGPAPACVQLRAGSCHPPPHARRSIVTTTDEGCETLPAGRGRR
jgi:hypothetical protein